MLDDAGLMHAICADQVDAFGELYDRYCRRAYRVAVAVCRDEGHAQDAVQEAFVSVWKRRGTYRAERGTVGGWLLSVVRYRAIDVMRRNGTHAAYPMDNEALAVHPARGDLAEETVRGDEARRLRAMLPLLPPAQQEVIVLAYFGQLSHTEIAAELDLPAGTVKGRMRLGLEKLRTAVERQSA